MSILGWVTIALFVLFALVFIVLWPWPAPPVEPVKHVLSPWYWSGTGLDDESEGLRCECGWLTLGDETQTRHNSAEHLRQANEVRT